MLSRLLRFGAKPAPEKPLWQQPFKVIRQSGSDYYAIGVLPQFKDFQKNPNKLPPYHVLSCKKVTYQEAGLLRVHCFDRPLVNEILGYEKNLTYKALWASCLHGGRFTSLDSGTHYLEFEYNTRPGCSRTLVRWLFDFGISSKHGPSEVALAVCDYLVDTAIPSWGDSMLLPRHTARCYWHTAIARKMLHTIEVLET